MTRAVSRALIFVCLCVGFAGVSAAADLLAPTSLAASAVSSSQINLSWVDPNTTETGVVVERSLLATSGFTAIASLPKNTRTYSDIGLAAGTTYYYRVQAVGRKGIFSPFSNVALATTGTSTPTPTPTPTPTATPAPTPVAPSALSATAASASQINLSWSDNSSNETGFKVERATSSAGPWGQIGTTAAASYADTGLSGSTTYWYRVRAYNTAGNSGYSNTASATTSASATAPAAPGNLAATAASPTQINLSWLDNSTNETGFKIERAAASAGPWSQIGTAVAGAVSYADANGLAASTPYWYRVRAFNTAGDSTYSNTATATTQGVAASGGSQLWATRFSGIGAFDNAYAMSLAVDPLGNSVVVGSFQRTVSFGGASLTSAGAGDVFVVKYSATGQHLWSQRFGGTADDVAQGVAVDAAGNVFVTGYFTGSASFGGATLTAVGQTDIFLAKYSSAGVHQWSAGYGGFNPDRGYSVAVDAGGSVVIAGYLVGTVDFGGGPLTSAGLADAFLAKFSSAGAHQWSRRFGGASSDIAETVAVDATGNIAAAGYFQGSADFGGGALTSAGGNDAFTARYDANGNHLWSRAWGGASDDRATGVAVDGAGSVLTTGTFTGSVSFGGPLLPNTGGADIFVVKTLASGAHSWSKGFGTGASVPESSNAVAVDGSGNVLLTGSIVGGVDFGGGPLNGNGSYDAFVTKLRSDSTHVWSKRYGALYDDRGWGIAADPTGNVYVTGDYYLSIDFGGGALVNEAGTDSFLAKLTP
jgi:fibronectin type 3 domain-containing protein